MVEFEAECWISCAQTDKHPPLKDLGSGDWLGRMELGWLKG